MVLVVVYLNDQPALRPEEVDEKAAHPHIHPGCWDPVAAAQSQELSLKRAAGRCLVDHIGHGNPPSPGSVDGRLPLLSGQDAPQVAKGP